MTNQLVVVTQTGDLFDVDGYTCDDGAKFRPEQMVVLVAARRESVELLAEVVQ
jgi:hypothetical protein